MVYFVSPYSIFVIYIWPQWDAPDNTIDNNLSLCIWPWLLLLNFFVLNMIFIKIGTEKYEFQHFLHPIYKKRQPDQTGRLLGEHFFVYPSRALREDQLSGHSFDTLAPYEFQWEEAEKTQRWLEDVISLSSGSHRKTIIRSGSRKSNTFCKIFVSSGHRPFEYMAR